MCIVAQVVGRAEPHNLALIHPEQDRVLTIRENARTQVGPTPAPDLVCLLFGLKPGATSGAVDFCCRQAQLLGVFAWETATGVLECCAWQK